VRAIQAAIGLLTAGVVYRLAVVVYSKSVAVWAAAITCFYPSLLGYANFLLSETLFTFFVVAFSWLVCEAIHRQQLGLLAAAGIAMGLGALTRSIMLLFSPIFAVIVFVSWRGGLGKRSLAAILPLVVFAVIIAPWAVRNTRLQKTFTLIDVMGGRNAMMGNYEYTPLERSWATISDVPEERQWHRILHRDLGVPLTQGQIDKLALRHAIQFVTSNPGLTLKRDIVKFFNFWQLDRVIVAAARTGYFGELTKWEQLVLAAIICGGYAAVLFAGIFGACCWPPEDRRFHWFLLASILFPCAIHTLIFAHARYHIPVMPLIGVYAGATFVNRAEFGLLRNSWPFRIAVTLCTIVTLGWLREVLFVDSNLLKHIIG
jgi:4-amino-4-deoxy-L-arabinose transferase-like glycosyltransferase